MRGLYVHPGKPLFEVERRGRQVFMELLMPRRRKGEELPPIRHTTLESLLYGGGATILALGLALVGLYRHRLPRAVGIAAGRTLAPPIRVLHTLHSGIVGDYVTWLVVGTALVGAVWAALLHG